jgi:hypothetical protein
LCLSSTFSLGRHDVLYDVRKKKVKVIGFGVSDFGIVVGRQNASDKRRTGRRVFARHVQRASNGACVR